MREPVFRCFCHLRSGRNDDGGNFASIIVTSNGGSTWSDSTVPPESRLCPLFPAHRLLSVTPGGGSGILKSSRRRVDVDRSGLRPFPPSPSRASRSSNAPPSMTTRSQRQQMAQPGYLELAPQGTSSLSSVSCPNAIHLCRSRRVATASQQSSGLRDGTDWSLLNQPSVDFLVIRVVRRGSNCVASAWLRAVERHHFEYQRSDSCGRSTSSIPSGSELNARHVYQPDDLHRRWEPTSHSTPYVDRHLQQRINLVAPDATRQRRRPHRDLVLSS